VKSHRSSKKYDSSGCRYGTAGNRWDGQGCARTANDGITCAGLLLLLRAPRAGKAQTLRTILAASLRHRRMCSGAVQLTIIET
jgi:hypothetical protein